MSKDLESDQKLHQEQAYGAETAMVMHRDAAVLLLLGTAQVLTPMAAAFAEKTRVRTFLSQLVSLPMAARCAAVFAGVVDLAFGCCYDHGVYHQALVFGYVLFLAPVALLFAAGNILPLLD